MKIIDDDDRQAKKIVAGKPIDRTAQAIASLARAVEALKNTPPPIVATEGPANQDTLDALNEISTRIQKLTQQVATRRPAGKWTFDVIRNQAGIIISIEATKN